MGSSTSLFAVLLILLFAAGANAGPTSQEVGLADTNDSGHIYTNVAYHQMQGGEYYGVSVTMDVYDLVLTDDQYSFAGVHISNGDIIQIGWEVSPPAYGDSRAHFSALSPDGHQHVCINTECSIGFQPEAGAPIALGDVIEPVSQPKGAKQNITIKVIKDSPSGDWLVYYGFNQPDPVLIGRYPKSLFPSGLADRATKVNIGGSVMAGNMGLIPMGSSHLLTNDSIAMATAASFTNIQIIDQNGKASLLKHDFPGYTSKPESYFVSPVIDGQFFYGGPN
uniref:Uncharacterized protein n=1 Tax=Avena sativa TaxID=4498 RepID=A0ACD5WMU6_AVESA